MKDKDTELIQEVYAGVLSAISEDRKCSKCRFYRPFRPILNARCAKHREVINQYGNNAFSHWVEEPEKSNKCEHFKPGMK